MQKDLYIDADSILYANAAKCQTISCLSTNKETLKTKHFESKTHFNTWIKQQENGNKDDWLHEPIYKISQEKSIAFSGIRDKIDSIIKTSDYKNVYIMIEGEGNYRMDYCSNYVQYKANRPPKPILYQECKQYMCEKYAGNIFLAKDQETDDIINMKAWESYNVAKRTRVKANATNVIAFIDKDIIANGRGLFINYNKLDEGIFWVDEITQQRNFWTQTLMGDTVDNIGGLPAVTQELRKKYGMKRCSVGEKGAEAILKDCNTPKEMVENVIECYQSHYGEEWEDALYDNAFFLYMKRSQDDRFDLRRLIKEAGVQL